MLHPSIFLLCFTNESCSIETQRDRNTRSNACFIVWNRTLMVGLRRTASLAPTRQAQLVIPHTSSKGTDPPHIPIPHILPSTSTCPKTSLVMGSRRRWRGQTVWAGVDWRRSQRRMCLRRVTLYRCVDLKPCARTLPDKGAL